MNYNIEYLLRYVSNDTYKKILKNKSNYILSLVEDNYIDTDLNIKYLNRHLPDTSLVQYLAGFREWNLSLT